MNPLVSTIQALSKELKPIPTETASKLPTLFDIKCVLFDVYGTLMVSGVGDISHSSDDNRKAAIEEVLGHLGIQLKIETSDPGSNLKSIILAHQQIQRENGIQYPEVDIREVWEEFLTLHTDSDTEAAPISALVENLSVRFELSVNATWPMPFLASTLAGLKTAGIKLGIVSNAQFFTPLLFDAYLEKSTQELGFTDELCQWSYAYKEAKPSQHLYQINADILREKFGIFPHQVLYVGNDMLNDITPATAVGFKTALFAGDKRSLRLRESDERTQGIVPDLIIQSLDQIIFSVV